MKRTKYSSLQSSKSRYFVITRDILIPILIIIVAIGLLAFILRGNYFKIKNITCELDFQPCERSNLLAELEKYKDINVLSFPKEELEEKILENNKTISRVNIEVKLPSSLIVQAVSSSPRIAIQVIGNDQTWVVLDDAFRVISIKELDPSVPTLIVAELEPTIIGQKITSEDTVRALELTRMIDDNLIEVEKINLEDSIISILLKNNLTAILTTSKSIEKQMLTLQAILTDDTILQEAKTIDVRFDQPVIKSD